MLDAPSHIGPQDAAKELLARQAARRDLLSFTTYTMPKYHVNWHHEVTCQVLTDVVRGLLPPDHAEYLPPAPPGGYVPGVNAPKRVAICQPPRNGKSELASRRLPAFAFGKIPDLQVISASYSADLASMMNRDVQRIIDGPRYQNVFPHVGLNEKNIRSDASGSYLRNNDIFEIVGYEGRYRSAGIGGGITGMGARLGIIDDPYKHRKDADSEAWRKTVKEWYTSTFYTRLDDPSAAIVIMMTRWHDEDLLGWLFDLERSNPNADQWLLINFPAILDAVPDAIKEPKHYDAYQRFERRQLGDLLWPEKYPIERLEAIRANDPGDFEALQQQRPIKPGGGMFPREKLAIIDRDTFMIWPDMLAVRGWDKAGTDGGGAYTAGVLIVFDPQRRYGASYIVADVQRIQYEALARETLIRTTAYADRGRYGYVVYAIEQEPASGGKESAQNTVRNTLAGFEVYAEPASNDGDKERRARPFSIQVKATNVALIEGEWNEAYLNELSRFPSGKYKDQVDASSLAFNKLALGWEDAGEVIEEEPLYISPF